ncbi:MAG: translation elongation factor Ts [Eggerthellales bacterium]|nr:translation elongation factor Ts [Eggerthellales bacterium]
MAITAAMVKELREMTGAGMMECKKALVEAEGDMDKAVDVLRTRGLAAVAKKAGRSTNEGYIMAITSDDAKTGVVVEVKCETDFVSSNEKFQGYVAKIAAAALASKETDIEAIKAVEYEGETVEAILTDCIHVMGENVQLTRIALVEGDAVVSYIHGAGKIGVLVNLAVEGIEPTAAGLTACGKDVAMQVAAMNPISATRDDVDPAVVEHEKSIYEAQAAESGKPEKFWAGIVNGRLNKFFAEQCLAEQVFVKAADGKQSVGAYVDACAAELGGSVKIVNFTRFQLGE